jgi:hypothetical protein
MARADGCDSDAGAVQRTGMDLRAKVRRHPIARLQKGQRRSVVFAQPPAAKHSRSPKAIERLPAQELILDGEITWRGGKVAYHVFDIMWLDGRNVTTLPLEERRDLVGANCRSTSIASRGLIEDPSPWERAQREGWEGVIAKRRGSIYEHRRSKEVAEDEVRVVAEFSGRRFY